MGRKGDGEPHREDLNRSYYNRGSGMTGWAEGDLKCIKVDNKRNMSMFIQLYSDLLSC